MSNELIQYLIAEAKVNDDIEIIVNTKLDINNIEKLIQKGLQDSYQDTKLIDKFYDSKQLKFLILGILFLVFSTIMKPELIKELILIVGWIAVWYVLEIAIKIDSKQKFNRKIINKLINCKIKVNNN